MTDHFGSCLCGTVRFQIKGDFDPMLKKVKQLDEAIIDPSQVGAVRVKP